MNFAFQIRSGIIRGIPIALGYIPIAITFGIIANSVGMPNYISILMSATVFAGASQFIAVNLFQVGTGFVEILITTFIVNLRHFLMSASLAQRIKDKISISWMPLVSFGITDETFSFLSLEPRDKLTSGYLLGINGLAYSAWVGGTILGVYLGRGLPEIIQTSMGISLYVMFIGLLVPNLRGVPNRILVSLLAMGVSAIFFWDPVGLSLSQGWNVIITTVLTSTVGAFVLTGEGGSDGE